MLKYLTKNNPYDIAFILKDRPDSRVAQDGFWESGGAAVDDDSVYPLPVPLRPSPNVTKYPATKIGDGFRAWLKGLQANNTAWTNIAFPSSGYFNKGGGREAPECVTTAGNFVPVIDYVGTRDNPKAIFVKTMQPDDAPDPLVVNHKTAALYCHLFMAGDVHNNFHGIASPTGRPAHCYTGMISPDGQGWIPREDDWTIRRFQLLPSLPMTVQTRSAMNVRSGPEVSDNRTGGLRYGEQIRVIAYYPTWDGLWFELARGGYICAVYKHQHPWIDYNISFTDFRLGATIALRPKYQIRTRKEKDMSNYVSIIPEGREVGKCYRNVDQDKYDRIEAILDGEELNDPETPEPDPSDPIFEKTNQEVINALYAVANKIGLGGWALLVTAVGNGHANTMSPAEARDDLYDGPSVDDMGITDDVKDDLREELMI
jgi:hypothetical protein